MSRLPLLKDDQLDPIANAAAADLRARGAEFPDIYRLLANAPDLLKVWMNIVWPLRDSQWASFALRETLIMYTALLLDSKYEWAHHWPTAVKAGVIEQKLRDLPNWRTSDLFDPKERAALEFSDCLIHTGKIPDQVHSELEKYFTVPEIVHIGLTVSVYICIARFASAFELEPEPAFQSIEQMPAHR